MTNEPKPSLHKSHFRWRVLLPIVAVLAIGFVVFGAEDRDAKVRSQILKKLAGRTVPDLKNLAARSSPTYSGPDSTESFEDILKLRESGDASAVQVLEKIMADHVGLSHIHGYAAAQALFCIGPPESDKILGPYLLTDRYQASRGIDYTFHWGMEESKRNQFIERYHLQNLSQDLQLKLDAATHQDSAGPRIEFTLRLTNVSDKSFPIPDRQVYLGDCLYFREIGGRFARTIETVQYDMPMPRWLELAPGASHTFNITALVRFDEPWKCHTDDVAFDIRKAGQYEVYAMLEAQPLTEEQRKFWKLTHCWEGRAVSKPIVVEIR